MERSSSKRKLNRIARLPRQAAAPVQSASQRQAFASPDFAHRDLAELQKTAGNSSTARLIAGAPSLSKRPLVSLTAQGVQRTLVQRHLPGVLAKLSTDLAQIRTTLSAYNPEDPANGDLMAYINKHVSDIAALPGMVTVVDTKDKLVQALALDMVARAETPTTIDAVMANATDEVMNKGGGGFTAKDGTVWMLASANDSSALFHELIHVLSGEGGVTQLSVTKGMLNEGFTNYFAEALAKKYSKTIYPAYPIATAWVEKFARKFGDSVAYNLYFKNNEALLYSTLAKQMKTNLDADKVIHDANKSKPTEKPATTKYKLTEVNLYCTAGKVKDEGALAVIIKKKISESYFMEATEPGLTMMDKFVFA